MGIKKKSKQKPAGYTSAYYDWRNKSLELGYWQNGKRHYDSINTSQYFYVEKKYSKFIGGDISLKRFIDRISECSDGKYSRVYYTCRYKEKREFVELLESKNIKHLELDVDPITRYMTEHPIQFGTQRVMFFDLETDSRLGFITTEKGTMLHPDSRILSVAFRMNDEDETKFLSMDNGLSDCIDDLKSDEANKEERRVLVEFLKHVYDSDLLVAWNGDGFDEPVLKNRCDALGINFDWRIVDFLDMLTMFKHPYYGYGRDDSAKGVKISYSLDNIAKTTLGMGKVDVKSHMIFDEWKDNFEMFEEYNKRDVDIMVALEKKFSYLENHTVLANVCNRFPSSRTVSSSTYLGDGILLWFGAKNGYRFPSRTFFGEEDKQKIEGAFVMEPVLGYHKSVVCVDVGSLYPNLIRTFNISPEKVDKDGDIKCANGVVFRSDERGIVPSVLDFTLSKREVHKKKMKEFAQNGMDGCLEQRIERQRSDAWKVASNSLYGLMGSPYSRIFSVDCAEAVTISGKEYVLKYAIEKAKESGLSVVYGDTDSLFISGETKIAKEFVDNFSDFVDEKVTSHGGKPGYIRLGIDAEYTTFVITSKKRYFGKKTTGKMDIKGLEIIRTDGCVYARELQRSIIDYFVENEPKIDEIETILNDWHGRLCEGIPVEQLALTVSLGQEIEDYKTETIQTRIAKDLIKRKREVHTGMKIPYIVVDSNKKNSQVHVDYCKGKYDAYFYWAKHVYPPVRRIFEAVWPDENRRWQYFQNLNFADKQVDMFQKQEREKVIDLFLKESDESKFEQMREIFLRYNGENEIRLYMKIGDDEVQFKPFLVDSKGVKLCEGLVEELEELFGYRVYYGCDKWL